jgi:outer membrane biosynthesis protein TonB
MDARRCTAVLIGVGLWIFAPGPLTAGPAGAAEARPAAADGALPVPTTTIDISASAPDAAPAEPEVAVVGAKRKPRGPDSSPPPPADSSPPPPPPPVAPPPPPEPVEPEPPPPPVTVPEVLPAPAPPEPPPPTRAPAGEPRVDNATRLPTTGNGLGSRFAALAGACLGFGGLFIAAGARRRQRRSA